MRRPLISIYAGFLKGYQSLATEAREEYKSNNEWPGFAQSEESVRWLWEKQFAAVAADNPAFDCTREFYPWGVLTHVVKLQLTCLTLSGRRRQIFPPPNPIGRVGYSDRRALRSRSTVKSLRGDETLLFFPVLCSAELYGSGGVPSELHRISLRRSIPCCIALLVQYLCVLRTNLSVPLSVASVAV